MAGEDILRKIKVREKIAQPVTTYIKHADTVDFNLLFWSAGTFYIQALCAILAGQSNQLVMKMTWTPITLEEVYDLILKAEKELNGDLLNFWELIKIYPEKWKEDTYGKEGNGFWVVGLIGKKVIYYNDIEEGFNVSDYKTYGTIDNYFCNQDELTWTVSRLFELIKFGGNVQGQAGPPINMV